MPTSNQTHLHEHSFTFLKIPNHFINSKGKKERPSRNRIRPKITVELCFESCVTGKWASWVLTPWENPNFPTMRRANRTKKFVYFMECSEVIDSFKIVSGWLWRVCEVNSHILFKITRSQVLHFLAYTCSLNAVFLRSKKVLHFH